MSAGCGLAGLEPREKPARGVLIVLVFIHQVFEVVPEDVALRIKQRESRNQNLLLLHSLQDPWVMPPVRHQTSTQSEKPTGQRVSPLCEDASSNHSESHHKNEKIRFAPV